MNFQKFFLAAGKNLHGFQTILEYHKKMFHRRKMEHRINNIDKSGLKLVYEDSHDLTFQELLAKDIS